MCDAISIGIAGLALSAVGTGVGVMGQMNQQAAAGAQQSYMAQLSRQRQQLAEQQARDAEQRGEVAEQKQRDLTAQRIGTQRAALAAQGTDLEGSPIDILGDTARAGEQDALTIRNNAAREAWGYRVQGAGFGADASMRESWSPSYYGAGSSLLMGASSIADKWRKFQDIDPSGGVTAGPAPAGGYGGYAGYANSLPGFS
jgi:hypothetical protein